MRLVSDTTQITLLKSLDLKLNGVRIKGKDFRLAGTAKTYIDLVISYIIQSRLKLSTKQFVDQNALDKLLLFKSVLSKAMIESGQEASEKPGKFINASSILRYKFVNSENLKMSFECGEVASYMTGVVEFLLSLLLEMGLEQASVMDKKLITKEILELAMADDPDMKFYLKKTS